MHDDLTHWLLIAFAGGVFVVGELCRPLLEEA